MGVVNVFADTSIVNRIFEIDVSETKDSLYEKDRLYLSKIKSGYIDKGVVKVFVNPSIKAQLYKTPDPFRKKQLLDLFNQLQFTSYNKTIFPFTFPAHFVTPEEKEVLGELRKKIRGFRGDDKIFLDAVASSQVEILLTTDRKHLACEKLRDYLIDKGFDAEIKILTPKELYEELQNHGL